MDEAQFLVFDTCNINQLLKDFGTPFGHMRLSTRQPFFRVILVGELF